MKKLIFFLLLLLISPAYSITNYNMKKNLSLGDEQIIIIYKDIDNITIINPLGENIILNTTKITSGVVKVSFKVELKGEYYVIFDDVTDVFYVDTYKKILTIKVLRGYLPAKNTKVEVYYKGQLIYTDFTDANGVVNMELLPLTYKIACEGVAKEINADNTNYVELQLEEQVGNIPLVNIPIYQRYLVMGAVILVFLLSIYFMIKKGVKEER
jgi:hypothetical protein